MSQKYSTTIGLEIHAELKTRTKMFCASKNDPDEKRPNVNICPVCMGYPGTLPVINKQAVAHVLRIGAAVGGKIADFTEFDRKNYFYPDIPKGYQISQYKYPLITGGSISGVALTRIHLEEDTASSSHEDGSYSLVDFNRAGVPLMELVTEPVIHDAETAVKFAKELQLLLTYLGAGEANMEKGEMRVEANISVAPQRSDLSVDPRSDLVLGTKVEVKNLNSFKAVERAIKYEVERHISLLESGQKITQETRGWDENKQSTFSQRQKEDSHDYRYFPDPDLPKLYLGEIPEFAFVVLKKELPELPWTKRGRFIADYGLKLEDIEIFINDIALASEFEGIVANLEARLPSKRDDLAKLASNYITSDFIGIRKNNPAVRLPDDFYELILMVSAGEISSRGAKDILTIAVQSSEKRTIRNIAKEKGLLQQSDPEALKKMVTEIISDNPTVVADYKAGKIAALQFLVGQGMKKSKGSGNPGVLKKLFEESLK